MPISKAEAAKRLLAEEPMTEYRIVVQRKNADDKWEKVFAMHGEASDENAALQRAASSRNRHPVFEPEIDKRAKNWRNDGEGVLYPNITVQLSGKNRNTFEIIGRVRLALKTAGVPMQQVGLFSKEATGGGLDTKVNGLDATLAVVVKWVNVS